MNVALPEESRILQAPLVADAGGRGRFAETGWRHTADPRYVALRQLVLAAIAPLPARDSAGTCGQPDR